jgi:anti-anti-sigma factor
MRLAPAADSLILVAPERLVAETRVDFRCAAMDCVARAADVEATMLVIDLEQTRELDASGLGMLVLLQKRAKEQGVSTRLAHASDRIRNLLMLTKLDGLFEMMEDAA